MIPRLATATFCVFLLLLLACTDALGPRGDGNSVRLVVQPSFGQIPTTALADDPASRVDNVHVLLRNAAGTVVLDTIIEWPLDQDTLRMELDVVVQGEETFELTLEGRSGDQVLFRAGPMSLALSSDGDAGTVETSPVLEYAGPGAEVAAVEVTGAPDVFVAGSAVALGAVGANDDGSEPEDLIVVWTSLDPDAATVDEDGRVQVGHDGSRAVSIEARVAFTTIADTIGGPVLPAELRVSTEANTLTALDAQLTLAAALLGEDGGDVTGVAVDWSVADPTVLELAEVAGAGVASEAVVRALTPGTTRVIATAGALADTAEVTVAQTVTRLEVDPAETTLEQIGATAQATASGFDANDHPVADASTDWVSRDPGVATVAEDGTITGASPGTAWIVATVHEAVDSLLAEVLNTEPEVEITAPANGAEFDEGDVITFHGNAEDLEDGDLSGQIEWVSDNPGELGTGPSVSAELEPGDHTITASVTDAHGGTASASITVTVKPNTPPSVSITSPAASITVSYGSAVSLEGAADDEQDGDLSSSIEWTSDLDGALGTGASLSIDDLSLGSHTITARVTDSRGLAASATRVVEVVNTPPEVTISSPAEDVTVGYGATVTLEATATDNEDGDLSGSIEWTSDIDGRLGAGPRISTNRLSIGEHTIRARVSDSQEAAAVATRMVEVTNNPPVVEITAPEDGAVFEEGTSIRIRGTAEDVEDGDVIDQTWWSSDIDGGIGRGASITVELSPGTHEIKLLAVDSHKARTSTTIEVTVRANTPPTVEITAPADGATFEEGQEITFEGTARDAQDGDLSAEIEWVSDNPGELGTGASVTATLEVGTHTVTATATDGRELTGSASITIEVNEAESPVASVEIVPTAATLFGIGATQQFSVTARDDSDAVVPDPTVTWTSLDSGVASVNEMGLATAVGSGSTGVVAKVGSAADTAVVTVDLDLDVLVMAGGHTNTTGDIADALSAQMPDFTFDTMFVNSQTPSVSGLSSYNVILLFEDGTFTNAKNVGDSVGAYIRNGGNVVIGTFYWQERSDHAFSRPGWGDLENLDPFVGPGGSEYNSDHLDTSSLVDHEMTQNVDSLWVDSYHGGVTAKIGTTVLAKWSDGVPLLGYRLESGGQRIVAISVYPGYARYGGFSGDFYQLWENALRWAAEGSTIAVSEGLDAALLHGRPPLSHPRQEGPLVPSRGGTIGDSERKPPVRRNPRP